MTLTGTQLVGHVGETVAEAAALIDDALGQELALPPLVVATRPAVVEQRLGLLARLQALVDLHEDRVLAAGVKAGVTAVLGRRASVDVEHGHARRPSVEIYRHER